MWVQGFFDTCKGGRMALGWRGGLLVRYRVEVWCCLSDLGVARGSAMRPCCDTARQQWKMCFDIGLQSIIGVSGGVVFIFAIWVDAYVPCYCY